MVARRLAWLVIGAAALALTWIAFRRHAIGDYGTESDFYGGYAEGARLIRGGRVDPSRYPVVGPGYDAALALLGLAVPDLFTAARWISIASATAVLVLWRSLIARRAGAEAALAAVALLAVNPSFLRYGYSATTDLLAIALQAVALHAMFASRDRLAPLRAGVFAALATLTRYNSIYLVPVGVLGALWLSTPATGSRARAAVLQLVGVAVIALPWWAFSLGAGFVPGASLLRNFSSFYRVEDQSRNVQDQLAAAADSFAKAAAADRGGTQMVAHALKNVPAHLARDARELLGLPAAWLCVAGLVLAAVDGGWRPLLPIGVAGALLFATLVPVFYSDRYSLALAPFYLTFAGMTVALRRWPFRLGSRGRGLAWIAVLIVIALTARRSIAYQRKVRADLPIEALDAGRALARVAAPDARVLSRKGQIAYYGGCRALPFPRMRTLRELGEYARQGRAGFLYFSWYEVALRPEFAFLLDTSATVPGLEVLNVTSQNPSVLYRVGPQFGRTPAWMSDPVASRVHLARAMVQVLPDSAAAGYWVMLGEDALAHVRNEEALRDADAAIHARPADPMGWMLAGETFRATDRLPEAIQAYERVLALDPAHPFARLALGWSHLGVGNAPMAARVWRSAIGPATDEPTLRQMIAIYQELGDSTAAHAARAALAAVRAR